MLNKFIYKTYSKEIFMSLLLRYCLALLLFIGVLSAESIELELNKEIYFSGEPITIHYSVPQNEVRPNNWVGIYKKGFKSGSDWDDVLYYFWANEQSDINIAENLNLKEGDYEARLFYDNSYDEEVVISFHVSDNLISDKEVYLKGETISFAYSIPQNEVRPNNWIGVYKKGKYSTWSNVKAWVWAKKESEVNLELPDSTTLEEGEYVARLFYNNSFDVEFSVEFSIKSIATEYKNYKPTDNITVVIPNPNRSQLSDNGDIGEKTWIGIFEENAVIDFDNVEEWNWVVEGQKRVHIGSLPIGNYKVVLFYNNSESPKSQYIFHVTEVGETNGKNILDYGVECDGSTDDNVSLNNAFKIEFENDNKSWGGHRTLIFPKDGECITSGIKWENIYGDSENRYTILGKGATLKAEGGQNVKNEGDDGCILWINNASYIKIENLDFDGNRNSRSDTNGTRRNIDFSVLPDDEEENIYQRLHNSNLLLLSVKNAILNNIDSNYAVQDGIYIGWRGDGYYPQNIQLNNCSASYAFRNNLTISNCINCTVNEGSYTYATGVAPESGIDVECDVNNPDGECLEDISIIKTIIKDNKGTGVSIADLYQPRNIQINKNSFINNRHSERSCDSKGISITASGMFGGTILDNVFTNTLPKN